MVEDNKIKSKRVAKNTLYLFLRMIVVMAVGLFTSRVVLQTLGVDDYGTYNVVGSVVVFFSFLKQAMSNATYRYIAYALGEGNEEKLRHTFSMAVNVHFIIAGLLLVLCETVGLWFLNAKLVFPEGRLMAANMAYQFSLLSFCFSVIQTPYNSSIVAHEHMSFFAVTSIWEVILKLIVVYLLVVLPGDNLINYSWLLAAVTIFLYLWYRIYCRKHFSECKYKRYWDDTMFRDMLKYSGWSILVNGADVAVAQSTVFFFNIFFGVAANAALGIANNVNSHINQFLSNFTQAFNPQIIKSYAQGDMQYFYKLLYSTSKLSYFLLLSVAVPIVLNIDFILHIWLGVVPDGTGLFVLLIVLFSLLDAFNAPLWNAVHATGKLRTHQILMSSIKIMNIPLAYMLLRMGYDAWTVLALKAALNLVCSIVRPIYMKRLIKLPLLTYCKNVVYPIILISVLTLPIPIYLCSIFENGWTRLAITSSSFIVMMCLFTYLWGLNDTERNLLLSGVKNKVRHLKKEINQEYSS